MLQWEHSAILLTFIKLPSVIKIFVLSNFEWPFYTGCEKKSEYDQELPQSKTGQVRLEPVCSAIATRLTIETLHIHVASLTIILCRE